jgi:hypothetical protein
MTSFEMELGEYGLVDIKADLGETEHDVGIDRDYINELTVIGADGEEIGLFDAEYDEVVEALFEHIEKDLRSFWY